MVFYVLFGILGIFTWFTEEPTVYYNNPPGRRKSPPKTEGETEAKTS